MRLRGAVDQQHPGAVAVGVAQQLRRAPGRPRSGPAAAGRRRVSGAGSSPGRRDRRPAHGDLAVPPPAGRAHQRPALRRPAPRPRPPSAGAARTSTARRRRPTRRRRRAGTRAPADPGTLWWISALGSRSARSDGAAMSETRADEGQGERAVGVQGHPGRRAVPTRRRCPRRPARPGPGRRAWCPRPGPADSSSYCRSTLNARTSTGCRPASSNPPTRKSTRGGSRSASTAATRAGVDLQPDHLEPGRPRAPAARRAPAWSRRRRRSRGRRPAAGRRRAAGGPGSRRASGRPGAAGWRSSCPRVGSPSARARPAASRGGLRCGDRRQRGAPLVVAPGLAHRSGG